MKLHLDSDLSQFSQATNSFLKSEQSLHSMILGHIKRHLELQKPMSLLARLENADGECVAAGIQTESNRALILSNTARDMAEGFASRLAERIDSLPGVNSPVPTVEVFAREWARVKQVPTKLCTDLRLFELTELIPTPVASGFGRSSEPRDRDVMFEWLMKFYEEAIPHDPKPTREDLYKAIDCGIELGRYFIWEDQNKLVSMVGSARETENEKWIAPVFTPQELRGRGYGSSLTSFVSQKILDSGKVGMLFTDQANPTSNSIYQKMGYKPLGDFKHIAFE